MTTTTTTSPAPAESIRFASFLAHNAAEFYRQVSDYLGQVTGLPAEFVSGLSPEEQDRLVDEGQIQVVFTCGLPYTRKAEAQPPLLYLLAAPVMAGPRYGDQPVYFTDIIVRTDSPYRNLAGLRGQSFAYNEIHSLSGYRLPAYHLLTLNESWRFFGELVQSGSHAASMDWVESGRVTAAAIDSVVLAMELNQRPERRDRLRVVETIGPMPMPPVAASRGLEAVLRDQLSQALLEMHTQPEGQAILSRAGMKRFAPVEDSHYEPIRQLRRVLRQAQYP